MTSVGETESVLRQAFPSPHPGLVSRSLLKAILEAPTNRKGGISDHSGDI